MKHASSVFVVALACSFLPGVAAAVPADTTGRVAVARPTLTASEKSVTEGDRITLRVRVPSAGAARRVVLQEQTPDLFGNPIWTPVTSKAARDRVTFRVVVTEENSIAYRVAVSYAGRAPVLSRATRVRVWRWIPFSTFTFHTKSSALVLHETDTIGGIARDTWGVHVDTPSVTAYDSLITPNRGCTRFRALIGLADRSQDGGTGVVTFAADGAEIYRSPTLGRGTTVPVDLTLPRPYRFGIGAAATSVGVARAYPLVADGELYCTGIKG